MARIADIGMLYYLAKMDWETVVVL